MNDLVTNTLEMSINVRQYGTTHADKFPAGSAGAALFGTVGDLNDEMRGLATLQAQNDRSYREQVTLKNAGLAVLRDQVETVARTARVMERAAPGLHDKFRLPDTTREQDLLATARGFAADAVPLRDEFVRHGIAANFFNDLADRIVSVEQAIELTAQKATARVNATDALAAAAKRTRQVVRDLNPIVRNVMAGDEAALNEWERASHVERPARRANGDAPGTNTPPANG
ncbi:MAG: hypothetical protein M3348_17315 [Acidobacteriota bacterium]|nr:hypothetical protein [Acidobacteriota bacterium]